MRAKRPKFAATVTQCIPTLCKPDPMAALNILRTTFETDRIPEDWLPIIEQFHEVWVFSSFDALAFRRSGVPLSVGKICEGAGAVFARAG
jgi:hypothetical protein